MAAAQTTDTARCDDTRDPRFTAHIAGEASGVGRMPMARSLDANVRPSGNT